MMKQTKQSQKGWKFAVVAVACAVFPLIVSAAGIPEVPPPTCVSNCGNTNSAPAAARQQTCKDITVRYACGTEQRCNTYPNRGTVCFDQEKYCTKSERVCN